MRSARCRNWAATSINSLREAHEFTELQVRGGHNNCCGPLACLHAHIYLTAPPLSKKGASHRPSQPISWHGISRTQLLIVSRVDDYDGSRVARPPRLVHLSQTTSATVKDEEQPDAQQPNTTAHCRVPTSSGTKLGKTNAVHSGCPPVSTTASETTSSSPRT